MEIPSKIYVRPSDSDDCPSNCGAGNLIMAHTKKMSDDVEFTKLYDMWHDVYNSSPISKEMSVENPIVIYSKEFSVICYNNYQFVKATDFVFAYGYKNVQWAWLKSLLP